MRFRSIGWSTDAIAIEVGTETALSTVSICESGSFTEYNWIAKMRLHSAESPLLFGGGTHYETRFLGGVKSLRKRGFPLWRTFGKSFAAEEGVVCHTQLSTNNGEYNVGLKGSAQLQDTSHFFSFVVNSRKSLSDDNLSEAFSVNPKIILL
jgi:hypothetical protein